MTTAKKNHYGIVAPDFWDLNSARDYVQTAQELDAPILLSFAQAHKHLISLEEAAAVGRLSISNVCRSLPRRFPFRSFCMAAPAPATTT